jgi:Asp-tRNA(Asn)/Glu-tRNA(Gln) amidotransferase A subunit family amidase
LPIGAQLLGKPLDEPMLLRVGTAIEAAAGIVDEHPRSFA